MDKTFQQKIQKYLADLEDSPKNWDVKNVSLWFSDILEIPEYVPIIKKKIINGKKLIKITCDDGLLKSTLGIYKLGTRKLIIQVMNNIKNRFGIKIDKKEFKNSEKKKIKKSRSLPSTISFSPPKEGKERKELLKSDSQFIILKKEFELKPLKENVEEWDNVDIFNWLKLNFLDEFFPFFESHSIRGDILMDLSEEYLKDMGIMSVGSIKRILKCIEGIKKDKGNSKEIIINNVNNENNNNNSNNELSLNLSFNDLESISNNNNIAPKLPQWNVSQVCDWFSDMGLETYRKTIHENKIDGNVLLTLDQSDLEEIGITSMGHKKKLLKYISDFKKFFINNNNCNN